MRFASLRHAPAHHRHRHHHQAAKGSPCPWFHTLLLVQLLSLPAWAAPVPEQPTRPVATYSIVAGDPENGELGVAVQSHWFQVGTVVPWAESGVGAVATQSLVNVSFGPRGLDLLRQGKSAQQALDALIASDPQSALRQVAVLDSEGGVAVWTGERCIAEAGHRRGKHYAVQANLMDRDTVWAAMGKAFEQAKGSLAERMLASLEAAEAQGGDLRGRQSAALVVVRGEASEQPWTDRLVDLRVDDHPRPLAELRRLLDLHHAYEAMNAGDEALGQDRLEQAMAHYGKAAELAPGIVELPFWQAVTLFGSGRDAEALAIFKRVFAEDMAWHRLVPRLVRSGLLPDEPKRIQSILNQAPDSANGER